ncbi:MAG: hypothetical protein ABI653_01395 [Bacteroidota bacterium]
MELLISQDLRKNVPQRLEKFLFNQNNFNDATLENTRILIIC